MEKSLPTPGCPARETNGGLPGLQRLQLRRLLAAFVNPPPENGGPTRGYRVTTSSSAAKGTGFTGVLGAAMWDRPFTTT